MSVRAAIGSGAGAAIFNHALFFIIGSGFFSSEHPAEPCLKVADGLSGVKQEKVLSPIAP